MVTFVRFLLVTLMLQVAPDRSAEGLSPVPKGKKFAVHLMEKMRALGWLHPDGSSSAVGPESNANESRRPLNKESFHQNTQKYTGWLMKVQGAESPWNQALY